MPSAPLSVPTRTQTIGRLPFGLAAAPASGSSAGRLTMPVQMLEIFMAFPRARFRPVFVTSPMSCSRATEEHRADQLEGAPRLSMARYRSLGGLTAAD